MSYSSLPAFKLFQLTALTLSLTLAGCGGGDGTDTIAPEPDTGVTQPGTGDGGSTIDTLNIATSNLVDINSNPVASIGLDGAYYEVLITDEKNEPVAGAKVSFAIDATGVMLSQTTSGSVLTDSEGFARIFLKPTGTEVSGAYTISATATFAGNTATVDKTFSVQSTKVSLSAFSVESVNLSSGAQTALSLIVSDAEGNTLNGVSVNLNASCGQIPAQITSDANGM